MPSYFTDLHFHSKYSRAVSQQMELPIMARWADIKGIDVITVSDFTHPAWFGQLTKKLQQQDNGLYRLTNRKHACHFMLTTELSCIYKKNDVARRIHHVIIMPDLASVKKFNSQLATIGNIKSDGRPILGLDSEELVKIVMDTSPRAMLIPAHIWTPWFSMFGSKSGFDTLEECFGGMAKHIHAIETGLSSDPPMNWRLSQLDRMSIVSFSDAHSPAKMGREATVFNLESLTYDAILEAIKHTNDKNKIDYTVEFFPEEGRYHFDGHRKCEVRLSPNETNKHKGVCPKCKKKLTVGVLYRVNELADRPEGYQPKNRPGFKSLVPLQEIIAAVMQKGVNTKTVVGEYESLIKKGQNEFNILLNIPLEELQKMTTPTIAEGIRRVRQGTISALPGYDGEYGTISIFSDQELRQAEKKQTTLF